MAFVKRRIEVTVRLAPTATNQPNVFANTGTDTVTFTNSRVSVRIRNAGGLAGSEADIVIWGLTPTLMNQFSTLGMVIKLIPGNTLLVTAGDERMGMSTVFLGTTQDAYADYNAAPDVPFRFQCFASAADLVAPYPASSYTGGTDVATIMSTIANKQKWGFENNGVNVQLASPYLTGSALEQVRKVAEAANIHWDLSPGTLQQDQKYILAIWPLYGSRPAKGIPLISPVTGMIGYPSYRQAGIVVKTVFDPRLIIGGQIKVESSIFTTQVLNRINNVSSIWNIASVDHALDANLPRGEWMSTIQAYNPLFPQPLFPSQAQ